MHRQQLHLNTFTSLLLGLGLLLRLGRDGFLLRLRRKQFLK